MRRSKEKVPPILCYYCEVNIANSWDHIIPYSKGGKTVTKNLVHSCKRCNSMLSNKLFKSVIDKRLYVREKLGLDKNLDSEIYRQIVKHQLNSPKKSSAYLDRRPRRTLSEILYGYPYNDATEP